MTESATPIDRSKAEFVDLAADAEKRPWSARPRRSTPT